MLAAHMRFHHFGLALASEQDTLPFLESMGYVVGTLVYDPLQNVNLRMCTHTSEPDIEIVLPGEGDGPLTKILGQSEAMIYHSCYEVDDLDTTLDAFDAADVRVFPISPPTPAVLFGGRKVSFYRIAGFGVTELLEPA